MEGWVYVPNKKTVCYTFDMEFLLSLIQDYGYLFLFIATLLEGETVLALAGFAASEGYLDIETVILVAFLGGMLGDQLFFYFGRWKGRVFLEKRPNMQKRADQVHRLIGRHPNLLIFGSRFMYGFRMLIPIAFGTSNVSWVRFLTFNFLGALVWSILFGVGGYLLGTAIQTYIGNIHRVEKYVLLGLVAGVIIVLVVRVVGRRITERVEKSAINKEQDEAVG